MFTGIVQAKAVVANIQEKEAFRQLTLSVTPSLLENVAQGVSIAVNGVCLTVTSFDIAAGKVQFDVIEETLRKTNLGLLQQGGPVNIERSLTFGSEIGGHIVSGHVQTTAKLVQVDKTASNCHFRLQLAAEFIPYVLTKGFIAVEGCSLTVGEVYADGFSLYLIPETLNITTLGTKQQGDLLNIELDAQTYTIIKTVERLMAERYSTV